MREERDIVENCRPGINGYIVKPVADLGLYWMLLNKVAHKTV